MSLVASEGRPSASKQLLRMAALFALYVSTAELARFLFIQGGAPARIWLPSGITWAFLILWGEDLWPAIALASVVFDALTLFVFPISAPASVGVGVALILFRAFGNTFEALAAVYFLRWVKFNPGISRLADIGLLLLAAILFSVIAPTVGFTALALTGKTISVTWALSWLGELVGVMLLAPFILRLGTQGRSAFTLAPRQYAETAVIFAILIAGAVISAWTPYAQIRGISTGFIVLTALVVDDNRAAAEGLGKLLQLDGHNVKLAYDGESALDAAREFLPEVIILDIGLPGISGYDVARRLARDGGASHAMLIALTGYRQAEDKQKSKEAGFDDHLTKPITLADLERVLEKYEEYPGVSASGN